MPLKYPAEWKFEGFPYAIPDEAHREFYQLVSMMAEGAKNPKSIYEDFKNAFGNSSVSSDTSWAESDMLSAMRSSKENAARYMAAFYAGMEFVERDGIEVPPVRKLNKILSDHGVPLLIDPPNLILKEGDIAFVPEDSSEELQSAAFIRGKEIGRGGFGAVYKVIRRTKIGEYHFAMKVLEPNVHIENKQRANKRFIREMKALEKLQHRSIVPLLEAGITAEQHPYILMPFIDGKDIRTALSGARPNVVYEVFDEMLRALEFAHEQGAIHRDLKPSNILVRASDRQPILLDFGCAYLMDEVEDSLTTTIIGTPGYIAPEVWEDPKQRETTQDVYSVGVMLYECIMCRRPRADNYDPVVDQFPEFKGIDGIIRACICSVNDRIIDVGRIRELLAKLK